MKTDGLFLTTLRDELRAALLPAAELRALQMKRLRALLDRAARFVPFYRALYRDHQATLAALQGAEDLWRLPAICKEDLQQAGVQDCADEREEHGRLIRQSTSGSLGPALEMFATPLEAQTHAALLWTGWMAQITADDRLFCMAAPYLRFQHQYVPNTFIGVQATADETRARFVEFQPTVVIGSVEAIALLAEDLRRHGLEERRRVRKVFPFGQTLTPTLRPMIESGFDAEIFDMYGANETLWLGCECERHDGLHVPATRAIVQIARLGQPDQPASPGELGEVIVTALARWTSPFIRYRLGDAAVMDETPCACGRATPRLRSLEGRLQDLLLATSGAWVSPGAVATDLAYGATAIRDHRVVQETPTSVRVWVVPTPTFSDDERRRIVEVMRRQLGAVDVAVEVVDEIPRDGSGKKRRVYRAFAGP